MQVDKEEKASNKLIKQVVNVHEEQYAPIDHINNWKENQKSPYFSKGGKQVINHPGEVRSSKMQHVTQPCGIGHTMSNACQPNVRRMSDGRSAIKTTLTQR